MPAISIWPRRVEDLYDLPDPMYSGIGNNENIDCMDLFRNCQRINGDSESDYIALPDA